MEMTVKSVLPDCEIPEYGHVGETRWAQLLQNLGKARMLVVHFIKGSRDCSRGRFGDLVKMVFTVPS